MYCNAGGCKWDCLDEDTFCGLCGLPLRRVEVSPRGVAFMIDSAGAAKSGPKPRTLSVKNSGLFPVRLRMGQTAPCREWLKVRYPDPDKRVSVLKCLVAVEDGAFLDYPHQDFEFTLGVGAGISAEITIPPDPRYAGRDMDGRLILKGQGLLSAEGQPLEEIEVPVTHGAAPEVEIQGKDEVTFRTGSERARVDFRIRSLARGYLTLAGPPRCSVPWLTPRRWPQAPIPPGSQGVVSFQLDSERLRSGQHSVSFGFTFQELPGEVVRQMAVSLRQPARVQPSKTYLGLGALTAYAVKSEPLVIENRGEDDLLILGAPTIQPGSLARNIRIIEDDPSHKRIHSRAQGDPGKSWTVQVDTQGLALGDHTATLVFSCNDPLRDVLEIQVAFQVRPLERTDQLLAIDFGTSNSCIAVARNFDEYQVLDLGSSGHAHPVYEVPTVFYFEGPDRFLVGEEAKNVEESSPERTVSSIKRYLGRHQNFKMPGQTLAPREIARTILRHLWERAAAALAAAPDEVLLTVPCNFDQRAIEDLVWATREAGFRPRTENDLILDEPSAAAFHYIVTHRDHLVARSPEHRILVYDFGGGTLDVALLHVVFGEDPMTRIVVQEVDGVSLGGDDLDEALLRHYVEELRSLQTPDGSVLGDVDLDRILTPVAGEADMELLANRTILRRVAEETKRHLSADPEMPAPEKRVAFPKIFLRDRQGRSVPLGPEHEGLTVSRARFEELVGPLLQEGQDLVTSVLERTRVDAKEIDVLLLTGGSSNVPLVRRLMREVCPGAEIPDPTRLPPKRSVALGAVTFGNLKRFEGSAGPAQLVIEPLRARVTFSVGTSDAMGTFVEILSRGALPLIGQYEMRVPSAAYDLHLVANRGPRGPRGSGESQFQEIGSVRIDPRVLPEMAPGQRIKLDFFFTQDRELTVKLMDRFLPVQLRTGLKGGLWL